MLSDAAMPAVGGFFLHATTFQQQKKNFLLVCHLSDAYRADRRKKKKLGELGNQQSVRVLEK